MQIGREIFEENLYRSSDRTSPQTGQKWFLLAGVKGWYVVPIFSAVCRWSQNGQKWFACWYAGLVDSSKFLGFMSVGSDWSKMVCLLVCRAGI